MIYTSFELLSRAETAVEGTLIVLALALIAAYGLAIWRVPRHLA
jgi:flagellin-like protein